jgi:hypothetical protein
MIGLADTTPINYSARFIGGLYPGLRPGLVYNGPSARVQKPGVPSDRAA